MSGSAETTNLLLLLIAVASLAQVTMLIVAAVVMARAWSSMQARMELAIGRLEMQTSPVLAKAERTLEQVERAAAAVEDAKHHADMAVDAAKRATTRAISRVGGPALSAVAAGATVLARRAEPEADAATPRQRSVVWPGAAGRRREG
jgi:hypothetical protein